MNPFILTPELIQWLQDRLVEFEHSEVTAVRVDILPGRCYNVLFQAFTKDDWVAQLELDEFDPDLRDPHKIAERLSALLKQHP
jgi:hypothetical protein